MRATMVLYRKYYGIISTKATNGINTRVALCLLRIVGSRLIYGVTSMEYLNNLTTYLKHSTVLSHQKLQISSLLLIPSNSAYCDFEATLVLG